MPQVRRKKDNFKWKTNNSKKKFLSGKNILSTLFIFTVLHNYQVRRLTKSFLYYVVPEHFVKSLNDMIFRRSLTNREEKILLTYLGNIVFQKSRQGLFLSKI